MLNVLLLILKIGPNGIPVRVSAQILRRPEEDPVRIPSKDVSEKLSKQSPVPTE